MEFPFPNLRASKTKIIVNYRFSLYGGTGNPSPTEEIIANVNYIKVHFDDLEIL